MWNIQTAQQQHIHTIAENVKIELSEHEKFLFSFNCCFATVVCYDIYFSYDAGMYLKTFKTQLKLDFKIQENTTNELVSDGL